MNRQRTREAASRHRQFVTRACAIGVLAVAAATLGACGSGGIKAKSTPTSNDANAKTSGCPLPKQATDKALAISNWSYYIDKETVKNFQAATGIATNYKEDFTDNEEIYAKYRPLLSQCRGIGKDMFVATDYMAARMIALGWAAKIDPAKVPNRSNLLPSLQHPAFDKDRTYTMPWQSGMTGIAYDKKAFAARGIPAPKSVKDLLNPKLKGKVTFLTEMRDSVGLFMLANGVDPAKATYADAKSTFDELEKAARGGQVRRFADSGYTADLSNGNAIAAMAWSGDVPQLLENNPNLEFVVPEEGGMLFSDNMMVLATSKHVADAEQWINYIYDPKNAAQITAEVQYISPVDGVPAELTKIDPKLASNPLIFPSADVQKRLHIFKGLTPAEEKLFNTRFQQILNG